MVSEISWGQKSENCENVTCWGQELTPLRHVTSVYIAPKQGQFLNIAECFLHLKTTDLTKLSTRLLPAILLSRRGRGLLCSASLVIWGCRCEVDAFSGSSSSSLHAVRNKTQNITHVTEAAGISSLCHISWRRTDTCFHFPQYQNPSTSLLITTQSLTSSDPHFLCPEAF